MMRAISSTSVGGSVRSGRQVGGVTVTLGTLPFDGTTVAPISSRVEVICSGVYSTPTSAVGRRERQLDRRGRLPTRRSGRRPDRRSRRRGRRAAATTRAAATRRHPRVDAALVALRRLARQLVPAHGARDRDRDPRSPASISTSVVVSDISVVAPPITPARPIGPEASATTRSVDIQLAHRAVERLERLALRRAPDHHAALQLREVVAVDRLPELEHRVVRDVDEQRDRADAGEAQPGCHPRRRGPGRVDAAHDARREDRAPRPPADRGAIVDRDVVAGARRRPRRRRPGRGTPRRSSASTPARCRGSRTRSRGRA